LLQFHNADCLGLALLADVKRAVCRNWAAEVCAAGLPALVDAHHAAGRT
jgi:hypothetical protein